MHEANGKQGVKALQRKVEQPVGFMARAALCAPSVPLYRKLFESETLNLSQVRSQSTDASKRATGRHGLHLRLTPAHP